MIRPSDQLLNRLNVIVTSQTRLEFQKHLRTWLKRIVDKPVFLNCPLWYPYLGFLEGVVNQLVLVARKTPPGEPFLLLANLRLKLDALVSGRVCMSYRSTNTYPWPDGQRLTIQRSSNSHFQAARGP
jgi:hypothetical protein